MFDKEWELIASTVFHSGISVNHVLAMILRTPFKIIADLND